MRSIGQKGDRTIPPLGDASMGSTNCGVRPSPAAATLEHPSLQNSSTPREPSTLLRPRTGALRLSRNDAIEFRGERATGPFCRATSPTAERTTTSPNSERAGAFDSAASCRRERPSWPFHPNQLHGYGAAASFAGCCAVTIQFNYECTRMHTNEDRRSQDFHRTGTESSNRERRRLKPRALFRPVDSCPLVFIRGFLLHGYG